jgi:3-dehydroquinate synthase
MLVKMKQLLIHSARINYPVIFETNLKDRLEKLRKEYKCHLFVDEKIWKAYKELFGNKKTYVSFKIFDSVEKKKTIEESSSYIEYLLKHNIHKDHKLVIVGGGIVQDIGSFIAHVLLRGVDWIFIPTTLLAMSDSCIGSKSGINVGKYKNQVGTFHPPSEIYIYLPFLDTLPQIEMVNGIGEIIKHILIKGGEQFNFINKNIDQLGKDKKITEEIIYKSLLIKKEIVEKDEFEKNIRKVLNYGHTFGHALEGYTKHKISHGVGVLIGMDIANYISVKKEMLSLSEFENIHNLIIKHIKKYHVVIKNYDSYLDFLSHDKKIIGNKVSAILSKGIGNIEIVKIQIDAMLKKYIKEYFRKYAN